MKYLTFIRRLPARIHANARRSRGSNPNLSELSNRNRELAEPSRPAVITINLGGR